MLVATALEEVVIERIRNHGPMPFAAFMSLALYHPRFGYYAAGERRTGWRGHFLTSPELDPTFGQLWAEGFERIWVASGRPHRFDVIEVGPGEGSLAAAVMDAASGGFAGALHLTLVERVARVQNRQREKLAHLRNVHWVSSFDEIHAIEAGCVFANELIDNLPVHLVEQQDGTLFEICVEEEQGRLVYTQRPPSNPELEKFLVRADIQPIDGHVYEVSLAAETFVARASRSIGCGAIVLIDYGLESTRFAERPAGTLLCYSDTGVDAEALERVGDKDITVHANWTVLRAAAETNGLKVDGPRRQREVLRTLGSRRIDEGLRAEHDRALAAKQGAPALKALSRRQALGALIDPVGLGGLGVLIASRGFAPDVIVQEESP